MQPKALPPKGILQYHRPEAKPRHVIYPPVMHHPLHIPHPQPRYHPIR